jgi:hypothetical protein
MTVEEASRNLAAAGNPPPTPSRKRCHRHIVKQQSMEKSLQFEEEFETLSNFLPLQWRNLMLKPHIYRARYFGFVDEDTVNMIRKEGISGHIMAPGNSMAYNLAFLKVRGRERQWQCETIKIIVSHVSSSFPYLCNR